MGSSRDGRGAPGSCPSERSWVLVLLTLLLPGLGPCRLRCRQVPSPFTTESGETAAVVGQPKMATPWRLPVVPTEVKSPTATKRAPPALCARSRMPWTAAGRRRGVRHVVLASPRPGSGRPRPGCGPLLVTVALAHAEEVAAPPMSSTPLTSPLGLVSFRIGRVAGEGDQAPARAAAARPPRPTAAEMSLLSRGRHDVVDMRTDVEVGAADGAGRGRVVGQLGAGLPVHRW